MYLQKKIDVVRIYEGLIVLFLNCELNEIVSKYLYSLHQSIYVTIIMYIKLEY